MKTKYSVFQFHTSLLSLALLVAFGAAQATAAGGRPNGGEAQAPAGAQAAPAQAAPQAPSFCGNQPVCAETPDFAATITDVRTSNWNGWKLIDVIVHFQ